MTTTYPNDNADDGVVPDARSFRAIGFEPRTRAERSRRTADVLARAARTWGQGRQALLNEAIWLNLPVARALAARYRNRGQSREDLEQVAFLALTRAVQGFEPGKGKDFLVYAVPTITGELKRFFRDAAWTVRPPRRLQELQAQVGPATEALTQELGRTPTAHELANRLSCSAADVAEAQRTEDSFRPQSLEDRGPTEGQALSDVLGQEEPGYANAEASATLKPLFRDLTSRERRIVHLRFYEQWSQRQIADDIGVTQMQVSRLLSGILAGLRRRLDS